MSFLLLGFFTGFSLILAIGAQNIFIIEQGLKKEFVFIVCLICTISDFLLIFLGIFLFHYFNNFFTPLVELILNILLLLFLINFIWGKIKVNNRAIKLELKDDKKYLFKTIYKTNIKDLISNLKKIIEENNIKGIIIGNPINMDGSLGKSAQSVKDVSINIAKLIDLPVCLWDERLSTVGAFNLSSQLDVNISKREKYIDKNAAAFILQGAIDYLNN